MELEIAFEWKSDYVLGVPELDSQHQLLLEIINRFSLAEHTETKQELLGLYLHFLQIHMEFEEQWMDQYEYSGKHTHYKQHVSGITKVHEVIAHFERGTQSPKKCAMDLFRWFLEHSIHEDQPFYQHIVQTRNKPQTPMP